MPSKNNAIARRSTKAPKADYAKKAYAVGSDGRRYVKILPVAGGFALEALTYEPSTDRPGTPVSATYKVIGPNGKALRTILTFTKGSFHVGDARAKSLRQAVQMAVAGQRPTRVRRARPVAQAPEAEATTEA